MREVKFRLIFRAPSQNFKILVILNILAYEKSYEHGFTKKCNGHKLCVKLREVEFRSIFRAPSQKFKKLIIPNVLAHGKSYEYDFTKKRDSHKLYAKSRMKSISRSNHDPRDLSQNLKNPV
ncbi:hypothetical protein GW17_00010731 [Ensete ventricosum]|nr:hypothetical protein GW17_00010731 [Ensete ventricosum]RZR82869.1 hypothetical protein BHM03_00009397 [Ensete ventricosum]